MSNLRSILGDTFRTDEYETRRDFSEPVKPGKYVVQILSAEVKPTKKQDGYLVELDMQILDGEYKGRHLWDKINIENPSKAAEEIGRRILATLWHALDLKEMIDTGQVVNGVVIAHVRVRHDDQYGDQNDITTYSAVNGEKPEQEPKPKQTDSRVDTKRPWERTEDDIPF